MTDNKHLLWRLRNNHTAKHLCDLAADAIEELEKQLKWYQDLNEREWFGTPIVDEPPKMKCMVGHIVFDNTPMAYACSNVNCPNTAKAIS